MNLRRLILLLACLLPALTARAQIDLLDQAARADQFPSEIDLRVLSLGLNNTARPGEWTGLQVRVTDRGGTQREVLLRVLLDDVDGDHAKYDTVITTNPNVDQPVWTYLRLPFDIAQTRIFAIQAFEAEEAESPDLATGFAPGRPLGQTTYNWGQNTLSTSGLIAVVGSPLPGGINHYAQSHRDAPDTNPLGHEVSSILQLTRPDDLPDRWMGMAMVREIIWNGPSPADLRLEQVRALREWIERGGHLVVIIPAVGQDWVALGNRELASVLPRVEVNRLEGQPLASLRPLLTDSNESDLQLPDTTVTLHTFTPMAEAAPGEADPILNDPEGRCIVASRSVGIGAVTVVGLPVWHRALQQNGLPEADVFWHRVLGRRGQIATQAELDRERAAGTLPSGGRASRVFDQDIPDFISKSGQSLVGVMLGLIVFIAYWLVAGPGGFAFLKLKGQSKHAWVAFFATTLAFTALAWGGATIIKPKRVEISHLTFLDQVYGQRVQRARSWASLLIPAYGDATVWLESDDAASAGGSRFVQTVAPWEPANAGVRGSFPDARDYAIDSRAPDRLTFPARATVKQLQFDWAGGIEWESIRPRVPDGVDPFSAIAKAPQGTPAPTPDGFDPLLVGELIHELPAPLDNVQVILFDRQNDISGDFGGKANLFCVARAWDHGLWQPGQVLDLARVTSRVAPGAAALDRTLDQLVTSSFIRDNSPSTGSQIDRFEWLAFFNLLGPPRKTPGFSQPPVARRQATHNLDISRWATRPCVVVIGTLSLEGDQSLPEPIGVAINGRTNKNPKVSGTTIVRWVYPLPPAPPDAPLPETNE